MTRRAVVATLLIVGCHQGVQEDLTGGADGGPLVRCGLEDGGYIEYGPHLRGCHVISGSLDILTGQPLEYAADLRAVEGHLRVSIGYFGVTGLEKLESVGSLYVGLLPNLQDLRGLRSLRFVKERFELETVGLGAPSMSLAGLESLEEVGSLLIQSTPIVSLEGLRSLTRVGGLRLKWNERLTGLDGAPSLRVVDGDLVLEDNPALSQAAIDVFRSRVEVRGKVVSTGNGR